MRGVLAPALVQGHGSLILARAMAQVSARAIAPGRVTARALVRALAIGRGLLCARHENA